MRMLARKYRENVLLQALNSEQGILGEIMPILANHSSGSDARRLSEYAARVIATAQKVNLGQLPEADFLEQMGLAGHLDINFSAQVVLQAYVGLVHEHNETKNNAVRVLRTASWALDNKENGVTSRSL